MRSAALALGAVLLGAACAPPAGIHHGHTNLLWVTVCTLRADHLGAYGYPHPTSPRLDAWAEGAVVFERALTPAPWTRPAMAAMVTGRHPRALGISGPRDSLRLALGEGFETTAERLRGAGYRTWGVSGNPNVSELFGFAQGFETFRAFDEVPFAKLQPKEKLAAEEAADLLLGWLRDSRSERPFFAHLVLVDVHEPYRRDVAERRLGGLRFATGRSAGYDLQIRYVDEVLGDLLAALPELGLEDTLVVLNSDHGEAFGERPGDRKHGENVYNSTIWVPWILHHPALAPRRISESVEAVDAMATVLELLGLPVEPELDARPLADAVRRGAAPRLRPLAVVETELAGARKAAALSQGWKLVVDDGGDPPARELYRWAEDPLERDDRAATQPDLVAELAARLASWRRERDARAPDERVLAEPTRAQCEALAALGYVEEGCGGPDAGAE